MGRRVWGDILLPRLKFSHQFVPDGVFKQAQFLKDRAAWGDFEPQCGSMGHELDT